MSGKVLSSAPRVCLAPNSYIFFSSVCTPSALATRGGGDAQFDLEADSLTKAAAVKQLALAASNADIDARRAAVRSSIARLCVIANACA